MNQQHDPVATASKAFVLCLSFMLGWFGMAGFGRAETEQFQVEEQSAIRWTRHIETLLDVPVHIDNDPKFLNWAEQYCDSLETLEDFALLAGALHAVVIQNKVDRDFWEVVLHALDFKEREKSGCARVKAGARKTKNENHEQRKFQGIDRSLAAGVAQVGAPQLCQQKHQQTHGPWHVSCASK